MTDFHRRGVEHQGRRGSRIDLQEGGCYLGIPQNPDHAVHEPVTINPVSTKSGAVHAYLTTLASNYSIPLGGPLRGAWRAHGAGYKHSPASHDHLRPCGGGTSGCSTA